MDNDLEEDGVIPAEDFRQAIESCRRDPAQDRYYVNAPAGARLFIGLQFYAAVHVDDFDDAHYRQCLSEIEPDLTLEDVGYLMAHVGDDAQTLAYLRDLRDRVQARPVAPSLHKVETQRLAADGADERSAEERAAENARLLREACARAVKERVAKAAALVAVLCVVALGGLVAWRACAGRPRTAPVEKAPSAAEAAQLAADRAARERQEKEAAAARVKLQQERVAAAEAERLARQKAQAELRAIQRKEADEKRAALAGQEAAKRRFMQIRQAFRSARSAFWRDVRAEDRIDSVKAETVFHCLLPSEGTSADVYELKAAPGKPPSVLRLLPDGGDEEVAFESFGKVAAQTAHILLHDGRAYLCPAAGQVEPVLRVPASEELFNPFKEAFGRLYDCARAFGVNNPDIAYEVAFLPKDASSEVAVGTVLFGNALKDYDFAEKVSQWMASRRAATAQKTRFNQRHRRRTVILTDGKDIRKRTDGVTEVPRAYTPGGSARRDGRRTPKEEQAYAKWQRLYDEAVRQERIVSEGHQPVDASDYTPGDAEVEAVLREGRVVFRPKK